MFRYNSITHMQSQAFINETGIQKHRAMCVGNFDLAKFFSTFMAPDRASFANQWYAVRLLQAEDRSETREMHHP
ncbi:MAG: hypothetical protein B9S37_12645 [Verrucomicrobiia bacterium Tous-C3TDCM]|nr:MAG: hypothetical protein B9S37_12645 [Verrucomicrobiae bacterium Tous-C3TDCM]